MIFVEWGVVKYTLNGWARSSILATAPESGKASFSPIQPGSSSRSLHHASSLLRPKLLNHGKWLAEAALWTCWVHRGDLESTTNTTILALDAVQFATVTQRYYDSLTESVFYARAFCEALNTTHFPTDYLEFTVKRIAMRISETGESSLERSSQVSESSPTSTGS
mmetsp:Transcript_931/g.1972  ORF Transcript_931/g.1972 Transcript_931/m.1972 type:complete len:165 (-) Transcript_931:192-686(-)